MNNKCEKSNQIVDRLLVAFPEFASSRERREVYDNDGPYTYMSYFGDFLLDRIDKDDNAEIVRRAFNFINDEFEHSLFNSYVWDLLLLELFSRLDMQQHYKNVANKLLTGRALAAFQTREGRPVE
ncbi:MAG: hypothetical protein KBC38_00750 [Candidatus Pacebacteria bacterium]|nr:hypothetical protein [Candidatus Paceibacterota bacterium]MBP9840525.1 hypothetical protein [Candidatus Paceibacterota bacterium]